MSNLGLNTSYTLHILILVILMVGCSIPEKHESKNGITYKVIEIDGCEYIWCKKYSMSGQAITHKGNCKNH